MKIIQMRNKMKSRQYVFSASCWLRGKHASVIQDTSRGASQTSCGTGVVLPW